MGIKGIDHWVIVAADLQRTLDFYAAVDEILALLKRNDVPVEAGPGPRSCARGMSTSVYFRDPDGNLVEFTVY